MRRQTSTFGTYTCPSDDVAWWGMKTVHGKLWKNGMWDINGQRRNVRHNKFRMTSYVRSNLPDIHRCGLLFTISDGGMCSWTILLFSCYEWSLLEWNLCYCLMPGIKISNAHRLLDDVLPYLWDPSTHYVRKTKKEYLQLGRNVSYSSGSDPYN
jgi:hypothetical protein